MNLIRPRSVRKPVTDELHGGVAGFHTEHWSDAQDAKVFAGRHISVHIPEHGFLLGDFGALFPAPDRRPRSFSHEGRIVPVIAGGAWSASGLYLENFIDALDATALAIDMSLTSHKIAMYNNTEAPDFGVETAYSATNEVAASGNYIAGGQVIITPTLTESPTGTIMYDLGDQVWASPTTVTAFGAKLYADALAGNNLIVGVNFAGSFASTAGTFTIQWASTGCWTIDCTP